MIGAVIFDLDGLLADTERLHCRAYQTAFAALGVRLPESEYREHWVRKGKGVGDYIAERNLRVDPDAVRRAKTRLYTELVTKSARPMPGAVALLDSLHSRKRLAIATSSYRAAARTVLKTLKIGKYFEYVAAKEDVRRFKPFADIFLHVARALGVPPGACVVIEDAEKGIRAARAAGMRSIAVPNRYTRDNDFSQATLVLDSLRSLTPEMIDNLSTV